MVRLHVCVELSLSNGQLISGKLVALKSCTSGEKERNRRKNEEKLVMLQGSQESCPSGWRNNSQFCPLEFAAVWSFFVGGGAFEGLLVGAVSLCSPCKTIKSPGAYGVGMRL